MKAKTDSSKIKDEISLIIKNGLSHLIIIVILILVLLFRIQTTPKVTKKL